MKKHPALLLGRGVEGCGVTKCAIEFAKHTKADIFADCNRPFARGKCHDYPITWEFDLQEERDRNYLAQSLNENYDVLLVFSLPDKEELSLGLIKLLHKVTITKAWLYFDHSKMALGSNVNLERTLECFDKVFAHSRDGSLATWMRANQGEQMPTFGKMSLGFNFDAHREKYWQHGSKVDLNTLRVLARVVKWKGPDLALDFHQRALRRLNFRTIIEGLEASLNYKLVLFQPKPNDDKRRDVINKFRQWEVGTSVDKNIEWGQERHGGPAYCYPIFDNDACMKRMALSGFGSDLYHLKPELYGNNIENCHAEVVASGAVPVFHKHFGEHVIHRSTGEPCIESKDSGTLWLDENNFDKVAQAMNSLSNDPHKWNRMREQAFEFWKAHADASFAVREIMRQL